MDTTLADPSRTLLPPTPPVPASSLPLATAGLRLGPTLGEGGLGVIQLAHQDLLGRDVAVKRLKRGSTTDALARLLHEARMMGCLEHPNVPPVHAVGVDPEGTPVLVMKRVDGDVWRPGGDLEDDVRVLIAVTDALLHAHERGVVHRDLKPANVMRGAHGVVYLVDWGAAWPAGDTAEVAGTPAFMAPEMYAVGPAAPSMDTWLVGAALAFLLTGQPPNAGDTFEACRLASTAERPPLPGDPELAAWAGRALAVDPADRPELGALRAGLGVWLASRGAARLAEAAERRIAHLESGDVDAAELTEALFALRQALEQRPDHVGWRARLDHLLELAVRDATTRDVRLDLAETWLTELERDGPHPLRADLDAAVARARKTADLAWQADYQVGYRARVRIYAAWLALFAVLVGIGEATGLASHGDARGNTVLAVLFLVSLLASAWWGRATVTANGANRATLAAFVLMAGLLVVDRAAGWALGVPVHLTLATDALLLGAVTLTLGFTYGRVNLALGAGLLAGAPAVLIAPESWAPWVFLLPASATGIAFVIAVRGGFARSVELRRPS